MLDHLLSPLASTPTDWWAIFREEEEEEEEEEELVISLWDY